MQANCQNPMKAAASDDDDSDDEEFDEEFDFMLVFACLHSYACEAYSVPILDSFHPLLLPVRVVFQEPPPLR